MRKTLTHDPGEETGRHEKRTGVTVRFADPHHLGRRGRHENTPGLFRPCRPEGTDPVELLIDIQAHPSNGLASSVPLGVWTRRHKDRPTLRRASRQFALPGVKSRQVRGRSS